MSIKINANPRTVKAGGVTHTVNPADADSRAIDAIFDYGLGRWFQDFVNSKVHAMAEEAAKAAGDEAADATEGTKAAKEKAAKAAREAFDKTAFKAGIDVESIFAERLAQFKTGEIATRGASGPAFTDLEEAVYDAVSDMRKVKGWEPIDAAFTSAKGLSTGERKRLVIDAAYAMPDKAVAAIESTAKAAIERKAALARLAIDS